MSNPCGQCGQTCDGDDGQDEYGQVFCAMCWRDYDQEADGVCVQCGVTRSTNALCSEDPEGPLCCKCWCSAKGLDDSEYAFQNACSRAARRSEAEEFQELAAQLVGRQQVRGKKSSGLEQPRHLQSNSRNKQRTAHNEPQRRRNPPRVARAATRPGQDAEGEDSEANVSSDDEGEMPAAAAGEGDPASDADTGRPVARRIKKQAQLIFQAGAQHGVDAYNIHRS